MSTKFHKDFDFEDEEQCFDVYEKNCIVSVYEGLLIYKKFKS